MEEIVITAADTIKIASLNLHNSSSMYLERVATAAMEAKSQNVDIFLAQEVLLGSKESVTNVFRNAGFEYSYLASALSPKSPNAKNSGTGIFSRLPYKNEIPLNLTESHGAQRASVLALDIHGYEVHVISAHLAWGAENGALRLNQVRILSDYARRIHERNEKAVVILGGTFNDTSEGDSVRHMNGLKTSETHQSAYWVDVASGTAIEKEPTTRYHDTWGIAASINSGVRIPLAVPNSNPGMPLSAELFGVTKTMEGYDLSDHYGVQSQIWLPEQNNS
jgi:endonuclease/exonuclease/phosphatase family metal-dependent hydrolase